MIAPISAASKRIEITSKGSANPSRLYEISAFPTSVTVDVLAGKGDATKANFIIVSSVSIAPAPTASADKRLCRLSAITAFSLMWLVSSTEKMINIPTLGSPEVWLEMEYKTDVPFFLYLLSGPSQRSVPVYQFNVKEGWNKIYFNLTPSIIQTGESEQRLYFRLSLPKYSAGNYKQDSGKVRIDNIRVVHF